MESCSKQKTGRKQTKTKSFLSVCSAPSAVKSPLEAGRRPCRTSIHCEGYVLISTSTAIAFYRFPFRYFSSSISRRLNNHHRLDDSSIIATQHNYASTPNQAHLPLPNHPLIANMVPPPVRCICGGTLTGEPQLRRFVCLCGLTIHSSLPDWVFCVRLRPFRSEADLQRNPDLDRYTDILASVHLSLSAARQSAAAKIRGTEVYHRGNHPNHANLETLESRWAHGHIPGQLPGRRLEAHVIRKA